MPSLIGVSLAHDPWTGPFWGVVKPLLTTRQVPIEYYLYSSPLFTGLALETSFIASTFGTYILVACSLFGTEFCTLIDSINLVGGAVFGRKWLRRK